MAATPHGCAAFKWLLTVMAMMIPNPDVEHTDAAIMRSTVLQIERRASEDVT